MTLLRYDSLFEDPFAGLENFFELAKDRSSRLNPFERLGSRPIPVDLFDDGKVYYVQAELPGVAKEDLSVEVENEVLRIRAVRKVGNPQQSQSVERTRQIRIAGDVDRAQLKARLENGILTVSLPKAEAATPRTIEIE